MTGANATLYVPGYGSKSVVCTRLGHGITIEADESESRMARVFYPTRQSSGSFTMRITCARASTYEDLHKWLVGYARKVSTDPVPAAMRVRVPARRFDKTGVLSGSLDFSRRYDDITHNIDLRFTGVEDAISFDSPLISRYIEARVGAATGATADDRGSRYFYPPGIQLTENDRRDAAEAARIRERIRLDDEDGGEIITPRTRDRF